MSPLILNCRFHHKRLLVVFQERDFLAAVLISGKSIQRDCVNAVEDGFFNIGIVPFQAAEQVLDFLPLGAAAPIVTNGAVFCKATGTLDKFQLIVPPPCDDVILMDTVHGPDQFHSLKMVAVQFGQHSLKLRAVKHPHYCCLDHIVEVMAKSNFIAAQFLCLAVKIPPAHPGAEVAGGLFAAVSHFENVRFKNRDGNPE